MLRNIRQEPTKRPSRWSHRSVYELTCDHCHIDFERQYTNAKIVHTKHFCSKKCTYASQSHGVMHQIVQNPFSKKEVQHKIRQTNLEKYGKEIAAQSEVCKEKFKQTMISKYGVQAPMQHPEIRKKSIMTCLKRYGVDNVAKCSIVKNKMHATSIKRYGDICAFKFAKDRIIKTNLKKYGVENSGWMFSKTKFKRGHLIIDGVVYWFRSSWEEIFLKWCEKKQNVKLLEQNTRIPYTYQNTQRNYYADYLIEYKNKHILCEIKPEKFVQTEINQVKFEAAKTFCNNSNTSFVIITEYIIEHMKNELFI